MEKRNEYAEPTQKKNTKYAIMEQREYAAMKTYGLRLCEQSCMNNFGNAYAPAISICSLLNQMQ